MSKDIKKSDTNSSHPIDLDSEQLKRLEELIDGLKKEVALPKKPNGKAEVAELRRHH